MGSFGWAASEHQKAWPPAYDTQQPAKKAFFNLTVQVFGGSIFFKEQEKK
jgi:hypothetical protein